MALAGLSRRTAIDERSHTLDWQRVQRDISRAELGHIDGAFLGGTVREIAEVNRIDDAGYEKHPGI